MNLREGIAGILRQVRGHQGVSAVELETTKRVLPVRTSFGPLLPLLLPYSRNHGLHPLRALHIQLCPLCQCILRVTLIAPRELNVFAMSVCDRCRPAGYGLLELQSECSHVRTVA